ncbi:MAG TPA: hypothetical protein VFE47_12830 [Tepidisphaeraceae bacterium]|nr:hypothetical protein [Tepidisphaeraceae bacterium]
MSRWPILRLSGARPATLVLLVATGLCGCTSWQTQAAQEIAADHRIPTPRPMELEPGTPQAAWRALMVAIIESDERAVCRLAIARPHMQVLWEDRGAFWGSGPAERGRLIAWIWEVPVHPLHIGETYTLGSANAPATRTVSFNEVDGSHALLRCGSSTVFTARKIDGAWRIDPTSMIGLLRHTLS